MRGCQAQAAASEKVTQVAKQTSRQHGSLLPSSPLASRTIRSRSVPSSTRGVAQALNPVRQDHTCAVRSASLRMADCHCRVRAPLAPSQVLIRFPSPARPTFRPWTARYWAASNWSDLGDSALGIMRSQCCAICCQTALSFGLREIPAIRWHFCALVRYSSGLLIGYSSSESQSSAGLRLLFATRTTKHGLVP
jgi:hypothetical protein